MEEEKVLLYMFTGLLESGKTSFINNVLQDDDFCDGRTNLVLSCEGGEIAYDKELLEKSNTKVIEITKQEDLNGDYFTQLKKEYNPAKVFLEFNGTWSVQAFLNTPFPQDWVLVEILGAVDATTFGMYVVNMRQMLYDQLYACEVILINRCTPVMKKSFLRLNLKSMSPRAQIIYESVDGSINSLEEDELFTPVDGVLELADHDYGLWYVDAFDNPAKYAGMKIKLRGALYHNETGGMVVGRKTMVCCEDDVSFAALLCHADPIFDFVDESWYELSGTIKEVYEESIQGNMPMLEIEYFQPCEKSEEEYVYFT